jgi:hypothetical protein
MGANVNSPLVTCRLFEPNLERSVKIFMRNLLWNSRLHKQETFRNGGHACTHL